MQGDKMSRNGIIATGALLWTVAIADGVAHAVSGDLLAPALMVIVGVVSVIVIAARHGRRLSERKLIRR
jgi:hypothetical protein